MGLKPPKMHPGLAGPRPRPRRPGPANPFEDRPPSWLSAPGAEPEARADRDEERSGPPPATGRLPFPD